MPIDPSISLAAAPQPQAGGGLAGNPLDALSKIANIQNSLNQAKLFQQSFAARQEAGQIMQSSGSIEEGLSRIMKSPLAPFMAEWAGQVRQMQQMEINTAKAREEMFESGMSYVNKNSLPIGLTNPAAMTKMLMANISGLPDEVKAKVIAAQNQQLEGLTQGLPSDTSKWSIGNKQEFDKRLMAVSLQTGSSMETINGILGEPFDKDFGYGIGSGRYDPITHAMNFATDPRTALKGEAAGTVQLPGGVTAPRPPIIPGQLGVGNTPTGGSGGYNDSNPLTPATPQQYIESPPGAAPAKMSVIGVPLIAPKMPPSQYGTGFGGLPIRDENQVKQADAANKLWDEDQKKFDAAQTAITTTDSINHYVDRMIQKAKDTGKGGFLAPGAFGEERLGIARGINTVSGMLGGGEVFDTGDAAAMEGLIKNSVLSGLAMTNQFLGQGREAFNTINQVYKANPGLMNSFLGIKLVNGGLAAMAQRQNEKQIVGNEWSRINNRDMTGFDAWFNEHFPASAYMKPVLDNFGLKPNGEVSNEKQLINLYRSGYIPWDVMHKIGMEQFNVDIQRGKNDKW